MKTYKHKITGKIVRETVAKYVDINNLDLIPKWVIEGATDWQEITGVNYLITKVKNGAGNIITYDDSGKPIHRDDNHEISKTMVLSAVLRTHVEVVQVKRITDNQLFSVGDVVEYSDRRYDIVSFLFIGERLIIKTNKIDLVIDDIEKIDCCVTVGTMFRCNKEKVKFSDGKMVYTVLKIDSEGVHVTWANGNSSVTYQIEDVNRNFDDSSWLIYVKPKPLLITEDGVKIFEGDTAFFISNSFEVLDIKVIEHDGIAPYHSIMGFKYYSTEASAIKARNEYVRPFYSKRKLKEKINRVIGDVSVKHKLYEELGL